MDECGGELQVAKYRSHTAPPPPKHRRGVNLREDGYAIPNEFNETGISSTFEHTVSLCFRDVGMG